MKLHQNCIQFFKGFARTKCECAYVCELADSSPPIGSEFFFNKPSFLCQWISRVQYPTWYNIGHFGGGKGHIVRLCAFARCMRLITSSFIINHIRLIVTEWQNASALYKSIKTSDTDKSHCLPLALLFKVSGSDYGFVFFFTEYA